MEFEKKCVNCINRDIWVSYKSCEDCDDRDGLKKWKIRDKKCLSCANHEGKIYFDGGVSSCCSCCESDFEYYVKGELKTKYKKKPIEIEAFQYDGDLMNTHGEYYVPQWAVDAWENDILYFDDSATCIGCPCYLYVKTLKGDIMVSVGDYIIKGLKGELYPCKEDIFEMTYDLV